LSYVDFIPHYSTRASLLSRISFIFRIADIYVRRTAARWLAGWLTGWLVGWLTGCSVGWLVGWFVGWLVGWLTCWHAGINVIAVFKQAIS